jgi:hypothetical protein
VRQLRRQRCRTCRAGAASDDWGDCLEDFNPSSPQVSRQPGAIGAGSFNAHACEVTERSHPDQEPVIASFGGGELGRVEDLAPIVDDRRDVDIPVGIHPANDNLLLICHAWSCLPSARWDRTTGRDGGQDTHGAAQGSYQVTSVRPAGAHPWSGRGRQIICKARSQSHAWSQAPPISRDPHIMCVTPCTYAPHRGQQGRNICTEHRRSGCYFALRLCPTSDRYSLASCTSILTGNSASGSS